MRFLKERERYELGIVSKQSELPSLKALPYTASIDRSLLKNLFYMCKLDTIAQTIASTRDVTDSHINSFVESLVERSASAATV